MQGIDSDLIRGHIDTIILNILGEGDKYGYEICKEVEIKSNGSYELKQPTLYSCLKRLESQGLISSYWEDSDIGGKRHYYKLTENGQQTYHKNQEDWKRSKQIIDNLISTEPSSASANEHEQKQEAETDAPTPASLIENSTTTSLNSDFDSFDNHDGDNRDEEDNDVETLSDSDDLIFDEMDKEVEIQDNGKYDYEEDEPKYLEHETNDDKAQKNGFEKVDDFNLPFDNDEYGSYCTQLVKNTPPDNQNNSNSTNDNDEDDNSSDDIMTLLGHFDNSRKSPSLLSKYAGEDDSKNSDLNLTQEDEFLAKFITGKYSEYNPNREEYLDALKERSIEEEKEEEVDEETKKLNELIAVDLSNIDDDKEFGDDSVSNNASSFFDAVDDEHIDDEIVPEKIENISITTENDNNNTEQEQNPVNEKPQTETYSPYSNITYYNLSKPVEEIKNVSSDELMSDFANKYDAELPEDKDSDDDVYLDFSASDNDKIIMDFSKQDETEDVNDAYSSINEDVSNTETYSNEPEDDYSSFMADLNEQGIKPEDVKPFENKIDLTSVYDKSSNNFSPNYTDNNVKEKLKEIAGNSNVNSILFDDNSEEKEMLVDPTLNATIKSSEDKPKDLSALKTDFSQEGITVRPLYKNVKEPVTSKTFIETNKIKMVRNWITFFIEAVLLGITLLIVNKVAFTSGSFMDTYIYFVCALSAILLLAMFSTVKYWINPYKKVTTKYAPRVSHLFALLFTVQFFVIIYCINLQFGFYSFSQTDYNHLNWIVPCVVALCPIIQSIVYEILYKSKNFHI